MTTCKNCRYWVTRLPNPTTGQCKRHAPRPFLQAVRQAIPLENDDTDWAEVRWPLTDHDDGCGEGAA